MEKQVVGLQEAVLLLLFVGVVLTAGISGSEGKRRRDHERITVMLKKIDQKTSDQWKILKKIFKVQLSKSLRIALKYNMMTSDAYLR